MKISLLRQLAAGATLLAAIYAAPAQAQTRTWVSGVGNDCRSVQPLRRCKTFAGALAKTAAGSEISVMDLGAFGQVTQAVTINGEGSLAGVLVPGGTASTSAAHS